MSNSETFKESFIKFLDLYCGINEFEIIIPIIENRLKRMLEKTEDVIKIFENDEILKSSMGFQHKIKDRIEILLKLNTGYESYFKWCAFLENLCKEGLGLQDGCPKKCRDELIELIKNGM